MYRLQNCYCLDAMTSCYLKGFLDPVRFHFQGGFSFLTMLRWAKHSFGPVAPPVDHLRNRAWPCTGHCPSLFFLSIIRTTTPVVSFTSILCACVYVDHCDWLGLQCTLSWCDRCSNHANKKSLFCVQYPLHVLTSDVVSLLPFPDSTCYYCVTMHLLLLWWSRIKKEWMNEWMSYQCPNQFYGYSNRYGPQGYGLQHGYRQKYGQQGYDRNW